MSEHFRTPEDALAYVQVHDDHAKRLSRAPMPTLRGAARGARHAARITLLEGGQGSRDEIVAEILALRYPLITEARQEVADRQALLAEQVHAGLNAQESS